MDRTRILEIITANLSPERLAHSLRVEEAALSLAARSNLSRANVSEAALLHDLCREMSRDSLLNLAVKFAIVIDDIERAEPILLHGSVAAAIAQQELGITEPTVLEAITYHITGAPQVSALTGLIFIADFIEPGRNFEASRVLREAAASLELQELLLKVYHRTINFVVRQGYLLHPRTIAGRNELVMKGVKDITWKNC